MKLLYIAPVSSASGYGSFSRDLAKGVIGDENFDVTTLDLDHGSYPKNVLQNNNPNHVDIANTIKSNLSDIPDVSICVSTPDNFKKGGKLNIGVFRGLLSDKIPSNWIDAINQMDLVITTTPHSKRLLSRESNLNTPIEVVEEIINFDVDQLNIDITDIGEQFCFLTLARWDNRKFGYGYNAVTEVVNTFIQTFSDTKNAPALILKTFGDNYSVTDRNNLVDLINGIKSVATNSKNLPSIYLLHGWITQGEVFSLYQSEKVKGVIDLNRSNTSKRTAIEARNFGIPIIGTREYSDLLVQSDRKPIPFEDGSVEWSCVNTDHLSVVLKQQYNDPMFIDDNTASTDLVGYNSFKQVIENYI